MVSWDLHAFLCSPDRQHEARFWALEERYFSQKAFQGFDTETNKVLGKQNMKKWRLLPRPDANTQQNRKYLKFLAAFPDNLSVVRCSSRKDVSLVSIC